MLYMTENLTASPVKILRQRQAHGQHLSSSSYRNTSDTTPPTYSNAAGTASSVNVTYDVTTSGIPVLTANIAQETNSHNLMAVWEQVAGANPPYNGTSYIMKETATWNGANWSWGTPSNRTIQGSVPSFDIAAIPSTSDDTIWVAYSRYDLVQTGVNYHANVEIDNIGDTTWTNFTTFNIRPFKTIQLATDGKWLYAFYPTGAGCGYLQEKPCTLAINAWKVNDSSETFGEVAIYQNTADVSILLGGAVLENANAVGNRVPQLFIVVADVNQSPNWGYTIKFLQVLILKPPV
jgi:hypothetical protein